MKKISDLDRRKQVSFNAFYFEQEKAQGKEYQHMSDIFSKINKINLWGATESVSGEGSTDRQTIQLKTELPLLLKEFHINSLIDAPCGDFGWLSSIDLPIKQYIGLDVLNDFIVSHHQQYTGNKKFEFYCKDISRDTLPKADLILSRDCLVHFSYQDIFRTLQNFKNSGSRYLLTTTFTDCQENSDITTGDWRLLNFEAPPFNFPAPIKLLVENCIESGDLYQDKSLGLWDLKQLSLSGV